MSTHQHVTPNGPIQELGRIPTFAEARELARFPSDLTFLEGTLRPGGGGPATNVFPATGEAIHGFRYSSIEQIDSAVTASRRVGSNWAGTPAAERAGILRRAARLIEEETERIALLITLENGKPLSNARADVRATVALIESAAGWATTITGTSLPEGPGVMEFSRLEPFGTVAVIMPFNSPFMFSGMKIAAALAMGNTVVAKAPEHAPSAAAVFAEYLTRAGLPAGVLSIIQGEAEIGRALVEDPRVAMVSFTGSSTVGATIGARAVENHKNVLLELGGKSAHIVFADAVMGSAVESVAASIFRNAGQRCFSGSRVLIEDSAFDSLLERLRIKLTSLRTGDPLDPATQVGSLISCREAERVEKMIGDAVDSGARIVMGGRRVGPSTAAFVEPTVIEVDASMNDLDIVQEEVFGPVVVVQRFHTLEEAISLGNSTKYGLAGGCWTTDLNKAMAVVRTLETGKIWVNSYGISSGPESTVSGWKNSGLGVEMGEAGMRAYTRSKQIIFATDPAGRTLPL